MRNRVAPRVCALVLFLASITAHNALAAGPLRVCVGDFANLGAATNNYWLGPFIADSIEKDLKILPGIRIVHGERKGSSNADAGIADAEALHSKLFAGARKAGARFAIGGDFSGDGGNISVNAYCWLAEEGRRVGGASFVSTFSDFCSRLADLSESLAGSLDIDYSEKQATWIRRAATTSLRAMSLYGKALTLPALSEQRGLFLLEAISADADYADAHSELGIYYYKTGQLASALDVFKRLAEVEPDYPHLYYNMGLVYRGMEDYARAAEMYNRALAPAPGDSDAWNNLGVAYYLMGEHDKAAEAFERALEIDPDDPNAFANLKIVPGTHRAESLRKTYLQATVEELRLHIETGAALYVNGDYWRAEEEFKKALEIDRDNFKANNNIALTYLKLGEIEKARKHFNRALEANPTAEDVRENLVRLAVKRIPAEDASPEAATSTGAVLGPLQRSRALCTAGKVHLERGTNKEAADAFSRALDLSPDYAEALIGLGTARFELGEYDKARDHFSAALFLEPENEAARKKMAEAEYVLSAVDEPTGKGRSFRVSRSLATEVRARCVRASRLYDAGRYEEAVGEYLRALDLAPNSVEILNNLANAHFKLGRHDRARRALKKAWSLDPANELVGRNLDTLAAAAGAYEATGPQWLEMFPVGLGGEKVMPEESKATASPKDAGNAPAPDAE